MATHSSILACRLLMDRGAWRATVHGVTKSQTRLKRLSVRAHKVVCAINLTSVSHILFTFCLWGCC